MAAGIVPPTISSIPATPEARNGNPVTGRPVPGWPADPGPGAGRCVLVGVGVGAGVGVSAGPGFGVSGHGLLLQSGVQCGSAVPGGGAISAMLLMVPVASFGTVP
jgi:hypothetical protein